ncbi:conserved hypothetical protein [Vibrio aestuarianus]|nr:conserved hypothetical protein [Vibrio aestuarianus]CAH8235322.1 conserved hypothetical protein [Vibrio aestuarianus]CAH8235779.1 conserved hypothetical protein [Vibrio aestuarianus]
MPTAQNEWPEKSQKIEPLNLSELHNAQLSGEQRTDQVAALHRKTLYLTHSKTATR